ncbi:MAG: alkaline phosphatase family protein [Stappiaceae bacterium]
MNGLQDKIMAGLASLFLCAQATAVQAQQTEQTERPRLVLQITVDQLRGDLIDRYSAGFGDRGFRYLTKNGAFYIDAHHRHANTETVVGHTTLATGTDPAVHGMVANIWFDRETGAPRYNVQDARYPLIGEGGVNEAAEIDPSQKNATTDGRSPAAILTSTISDEIALSLGPNAKVFGVSVKDRGAISMAGHAGNAYWFSKSAGAFITSTFYEKAYPAWVDAWNAKGMPASYANTAWELTGERTDYLFGNNDDQPWETDFPGFGRVFPHPFGPQDDKYFTTRLTLSPAGDEMVLDFAKALIEAETIGQDDVADYLSLSFSSTDYVGHIFGPSSLEAEENLRRLDRTLADLFSFIDDKVGLERTLIVLAADHGAPEVPDYLRTLGIEASYFNIDEVDTEPAVQALKKQFGIEGALVEDFAQPYVYLNKQEIADLGLEPETVARAMAREIRKLPGIFDAISSFDLETASVALTPVSRAVRANFNPDRSGDIYVVFDPHWFVGDFDGLVVASSHGSPWNYDTHVPIIFSGPGIKPGRIARRVETVDVAPTIAAYLRVKQPSGSRGQLLSEVLD